MIKAVIFDFDGLIFDTETHDYLVLKEIFEEHGCDFSLDMWGSQIGTFTGFNPLKYLQQQSKEKLDYDILNNHRQERFQERIKNEGPLPGVVDYLDAAKDLGLKIGLASSSNFDWVSTHLKNLGLDNRFDCICTSDDVEKVKPDPALYLLAAKRLGIKSEECLVFEDSANGAEAAKKANMYCVVIPNSVTKDLQFGEVDHRLTSMAEMKLQDLIERFV